jgi:Flp pilus assembly pilin Flp
MKKSLERFRHRKTGAALVEYVVLMGLIGVTSMGMVLSMGEGVRDVFGDSQVSLASATDQAGSTDLGDTEVAEAEDDGACYTVTSATDYYDPAYTCYEVDRSLDVELDYTSLTSDFLTIEFTAPSSYPTGNAPYVSVQNGELIWDSVGPQGEGYIGTLDFDTYDVINTDGNVSITFVSESCEDIKVRLYSSTTGQITTGDDSEFYFDNSLDSFSCYSEYLGTTIDIDVDESFFSDDDDSGTSIDDGDDLDLDDLDDLDYNYYLYDGQIYDGEGAYGDGILVWDAYHDGYANLPPRVTWKLDSEGYVTHNPGEYCFYYIDAGYYITDGGGFGGVGYCEPRSELEAAGVGESLIDDVPYNDGYPDP